MKCHDKKEPKTICKTLTVKTRGKLEMLMLAFIIPAETKAVQDNYDWSNLIGKIVFVQNAQLKQVKK